MARIPVYKNSILASLCSMLGAGCVMIGIAIGLTGEAEIIESVYVIIVGGLFLFLAAIISKNKQFRVWKKKIERGGLVPIIQNDVSSAVQVYQTFPCKKSLKYIRSLNPQAADVIAQGK